MCDCDVSNFLKLRLVLTLYISQSSIAAKVGLWPCFAAFVGGPKFVIMLLHTRHSQDTGSSSPNLVLVLAMRVKNRSPVNDLLG